MRIIYAGTPEFSVPALERLAASRHHLVAVYTQPDRAAGRGRKIQFSPVKSCALKHELTVVQPQSFKDPEAVEQFKSFAPDLMVVAAYGILLPPSILNAPGLGCINIHASLLPRWRGAAPIQRAILAGDEETGITLMQMDEGLDTGHMLVKSSIHIDSEKSAAQLHDELKLLGEKLLMDNLDRIEKGSVIAQHQNDAEACYASKISKSEAEIDWNKSAETIHREVRAFNPWPVSFTALKGQSIKIWSACHRSEACALQPGQVISHNRQGIDVCCGSGVLVIKELQFAGKKRSGADQLLNSRNLTHESFGS
jgi:methionyl-tRNA formyltransferase